MPLNSSSSPLNLLICSSYLYIDFSSRKLKKNDKMLKNCLRSRLTSVLDQSENVTIGYSAPKTSEYPFSERSNIKKKDYGKKKVGWRKNI